VDLGRVLAGAFCLALGLLLSWRLPTWWNGDAEPMRTTYSEFVVTPGVAHGMVRALLPAAGCLCFGGLTALLSGVMPEAVEQRPAWLSVLAAVSTLMLACTALIVAINRPRWLVPPRHRSSSGVIGEWRTRRSRE
jgi:hypothetical protein